MAADAPPESKQLTAPRRTSRLGGRQKAAVLLVSLGRERAAEVAHGPSGLSATVTADTAQAAHALQKAAGELQRTLAELGLSLVRLDIGVTGEGPAARGRDDRGTPADDHGAGPNAALDQAPDDDPTAARTLELPDGVLVDVLA